MPRDRRLNATEVEAILRRYSFTLISQKGSRRAECRPETTSHCPLSQGTRSPHWNATKHHDHS